MKPRRRRPSFETLEPRELLTGVGKVVAVTHELCDVDRPTTVQLGLSISDRDGREVSQVRVGEPFQLIFSAQDMRGKPGGVFAAYMDVTFDPRRLQPTSEVLFGPLFSVARYADLEVPGLLDDVGAASGLLSPIGGDNVPVFSIELVATSAGPLTIQTDPADEIISHDLLVYGDDDPVPISLVDYPEITIDVLPAGEPLPDADSQQLIMASDANVQQAFRRFCATVHYAEASDIDQESPQESEVDDREVDQNPKTSKPAGNADITEPRQTPTTVTHDLCEVDQPAVVRMGLSITDDDGSELSHVRVGEPFLLTFHVQDTREDPLGVFAAFMDITFDPQRLQPTSDVRFGPLFSVARNAGLEEPGLLDDVGAASGMLSLDGSHELFVFSAELIATSAGPVTIQTNPADEMVIHDILVYGDNDPVPISAVDYPQLTIEVLPAGKPLPDADSQQLIMTPDANPQQSFRRFCATVHRQEVADNQRQPPSDPRDIVLTEFAVERQTAASTDGWPQRDFAPSPPGTIHRLSVNDALLPSRSFDAFTPESWNHGTFSSLARAAVAYPATEAYLAAAGNLSPHQRGTIPSRPRLLWLPPANSDTSIPPGVFAVKSTPGQVASIFPTGPTTLNTVTSPRPQRLVERDSTAGHIKPTAADAAISEMLFGSKTETNSARGIFLPFHSALPLDELSEELMEAVSES